MRGRFEELAGPPARSRAPVAPAAPAAPSAFTGGPASRSLRRWTALGLGALVLLVASSAFAKPFDYGAGTEYRTLFDADSNLGWINPRIIIWVLAQLHLLFAAFVLAVPMFVLIIEIVGLTSRDREQARKYDGLAHEFCRLLTTAFSVTSILGAILTFSCIGLYPRFFNYLVEVFGPTMYLYACIFFGESFSLYIYYYGWGKLRRWSHALVGLCLNVFGITLMLIANAWTTFMMAPAGLDKNGAVVDRTAAFFNHLLNPINIHRLIANLCLGGSVAGAYAAYRFLSTTDPERRAYYDWMGYIGNFIAVLALLPLPFAGYYLGYEIYGYNQQLGIYMMGGVLSWLFIVQAVLIGALFLGANYYLWLGMDRIEGSERYRGWIKFMLALMTVCMLVWATPRSIISIITSSEIEAMGGPNHPVLGVFGVMSAKNTAVNLIILTTFLSFILYRRGNKVATVDWAPSGKMMQALAFGAAAAVVVVIGIGGYVPGMWLESTKRIGMSPYQVISVLICMVVVMTIDVLMFRGAKEIGSINWGRVSTRSQYCLIFLAVTFTWTMGLMGFARSSLRQHWHVYEVLKDTSANAYTPALGYATTVITVVVMLFFGLVGMVVWVSDLGHAEVEEEDVEAPPLSGWERWRPRVFTAATAALIIGLIAAASGARRRPPDLEELQTLRKQERAMLGRYDQVSKERGIYQVPVQDAVDLVLKNGGYLRGIDATDQLVDRGGSDPVVRGAAKGATLAYREPDKGAIAVVSLDESGVPGPPKLVAGLANTEQLIACGSEVLAISREGAVLRTSAIDPARGTAAPAQALAGEAKGAHVECAGERPQRVQGAREPAREVRSSTVSTSGLRAVFHRDSGVLAAVDAAGRELPLRTYAAADLVEGSEPALAVLGNDAVLACVALRSQGLVCSSRYGGAVRVLDPALQGAALEAAVAAHKARSARITAEALDRRGASLMESKRHAEAARIFDLAATASTGFEQAIYDAARAYALLGDTAKAVARLEQLRALKSPAAVTLLDNTGRDDAFASCRTDPAFRKAIGSE